MLISTLEAYFQGKKEVFQGLAMEELEKEWVQHPILHLDLNIEKYDSVESLGNILNDNLTRWGEPLRAGSFGSFLFIAICGGYSPGSRADGGSGW